MASEADEVAGLDKVLTRLATTEDITLEKASDMSNYFSSLDLEIRSHYLVWHAHCHASFSGPSEAHPRGNWFTQEPT